MLLVKLISGDIYMQTSKALNIGNKYHDGDMERIVLQDDSIASRKAPITLTMQDFQELYEKKLREIEKA